ncbi:PRAG1 kinase, partial [Polypterus senegalus]
MSVCSDFAEHMWKPDSCKNCFYPRSSHRLQRNFETLAKAVSPTSTSALWSKTESAEEDYVVSPSYSKPTIAVKPTMMNSDVVEMWSDMNMNTGVQQGNQKSPTEKSTKMPTKVFIDSNSNNGLRDVLPNNTSTLNGYSKFLPAGALPSLERKLNSHGNSAFISNIFISQEDGRVPFVYRENEPQLSKSYKEQLVKSPRSSCVNSDRKTTGSFEGGGGRTFSTEICESRGEGPWCLSNVNEQHAPFEIAVNIVVPAGGISENSDLSHSVLAQEKGANDISATLQCAKSKGLSSLPEAASQIESFSLQSISERLDNSQELDHCKELPSKSLECSLVQAQSEPIYAESTKRIKKLLSESKSNSGPPQVRNTFHKTLEQSESIESSCSNEKEAVDLASSWSKITVMAAHTEEENRTFCLSSPDSAVSIQWQHISPSPVQEAGSPLTTFQWPHANSTQQASDLWPVAKSCSTMLHPKSSAHPSLAVSPKLSPSLCESGKENTETLRYIEHPTSFSSIQLQSKSSGNIGNSGSSISASERRHKYQHSAWNREYKIVEEEEAAVVNEETTQQSKAPSIFCSSVSGQRAQEARVENAVMCSSEYNNHELAYNGAGHHHAGRAPDQDRCSRNNQCASESRPSSSSEHTSTLSELAPPPPPPKKHLRTSNKMSQSNSDLEKASHGSVESLTHSLKGLHCGIPATSTDSLHSDSRTYADAGRQECTRSPSPPLFIKGASPLASQYDASVADYTHSLLPPPLPEKKMINRTISAPDGARDRRVIHNRSSPHLNLSSSESNMCITEKLQLSTPSSPVDQRNIFSSNESLERCHPTATHPLRSQTMDEVTGRRKARLGLGAKSGGSFSSSPQLSTPSSGSHLQLHTLLSNIDSREGVYAKLGSLYAESLRRLALKCEERFTRGQKNPLRFDESSWSLFKLTCNKPCCIAGDSVYYSASCAKDPKNDYAVKICKNRSPESKQSHFYGLEVQQNLPPHFNVQQDCGHFIACVPLSMLPPGEAAGLICNSQQEQEAPRSRDLGTSSQSDSERVVVITREVPYQTTADFVKEWATYHRDQPEWYERWVCFLLLQLCNGLEYLKEHGVIHRDLCLENLLLVHHSKRSSSESKAQRQLPRLVISNFAKAKQRTSSTTLDPKSKKDQARLAPEIVSASQYKKFDEFQAGILIYELLHQPNPFEVSPKLKEQEYSCKDLPEIPDASIYSAGLQQLAHLLLEPDPSKRIHIQEAKRILQSLLWGPRKDLLEQQWEQRHNNHVLDEGLHNWLDVKRALLMMKFAEKSLEPEQSVELEDWLCCQYFAVANPVSLCRTAELLHFSE